VLSGRPVADAIWHDVEAAVADLSDRRPPHLAVVDAAGDPAAASYLRQIVRSFERHGLGVSVHAPDRADESSIITVLHEQAADPAATGILLTLPLPSGVSLDAVLAHLPVGKDVEGIHPTNAGYLAQGRPRIVPSTPKAGMEILKSAGVDLTGKVAVIVGRTPIVGGPLGGN